MKTRRPFEGVNSSFFRVISFEMVLAALIIMPLAMSGVKYLHEGYAKGAFTAALGAAANHKNAVVMYYSIRGEMPENEQALIDAGIYALLGEPRQYGQNVSDIQIEQGAIHIFISGEDEVVSWRPATLKEDPLSSIVWTVSDHYDAEKWSAYGPDRTNVVLDEIRASYFIN